MHFFDVFVGEGGGGGWGGRAYKCSQYPLE